MDKQLYCTLIPFSNQNGVPLMGLLFQAPQADTTVVHIHGSCGNFWSAGFLPVLAQTLTRSRINLFTANTSAHDCITEGARNGQFAYIGGSISHFPECVLDIRAVIELLKPFSTRIVLQGHSLGCDRVTYFQLETASTFDTILICPCDSFQLHANFRAPETVSEQIERLQHLVSDGLRLLDESEYGIHSRGEDYRIPITRQALLAIMQGPPFKLFKISEPCDFSLQARCLTCIGGSDDLQTVDPLVMFDYLRPRFRELAAYLEPGANHEFAGYEEALANRIVNWIRATG